MKCWVSVPFGNELNFFWGLFLFSPGISGRLSPPDRGLAGNLSTSCQILLMITIGQTMDVTHHINWSHDLLFSDEQANFFFSVLKVIFGKFVCCHKYCRFVTSQLVGKLLSMLCVWSISAGESVINLQWSPW